jgi:hypothetical protein
VHDDVCPWSYTGGMIGLRSTLGGNCVPTPRSNEYFFIASRFSILDFSNPYCRVMRVLLAKVKNVQNNVFLNVCNQYVAWCILSNTGNGTFQQFYF